MIVNRRGSKSYFAALGVVQICAVVRYAVLARVLGPEQLGMAALIVLTGQFFDSLTDTGNDRFLVQDRDGGSRPAFRLVESVALTRGTLMALLILLLARPVAELARAPQVTDGLRIFALVPFITGFTNYDYRSAQRHHEFRPEAAVLVASESAALVVTIFAALLLRSFTAILYGLSTRALVGVAVSHVVAKRAYGLGYEPVLARRMWLFGAPLMLNGLLLFIASQGDRLIVSRMLGLEELGRYSVVLLLVLYPTSMMIRFTAGIFLPLISGARDDPLHQSKVVDQLGGIILVLSVGISVGFACVAPAVIPLIFGKAYAQSWILPATVGTMMALRLMKEAPTIAALAFARSDIVLSINLLRLFAIPAALVALSFSRTLEALVLGLTIGELLSNVGGAMLVNRVAGWPLFRGLDRYAAFVIIAAALLLSASFREAIGSSVFVSAILVPLALAAVLWRERSSVAPLWSGMRKLRPR